MKTLASDMYGLGVGLVLLATLIHGGLMICMTGLVAASRRLRPSIVYQMRASSVALLIPSGFFAYRMAKEAVRNPWSEGLPIAVATIVFLILNCGIAYSAMSKANVDAEFSEGCKTPSIRIAIWFTGLPVLAFFIVGYLVV